MDIPLKQRVRRSSEALRATLNLPYRDAIRILLDALPHMSGEFRGEIVPDFIEVYGLKDFEFSLKALRNGTQYGSGEFAIRAYLQHDFSAAYKAMCRWATAPNEHVRRLASEGLRPRLPWAAQLPFLREDPSPCFKLLGGLMTDESKYVRTSVGNHLNDISKDNPEALLRFLNGVDQEQPTTRWITTKALRTLGHTMVHHSTRQLYPGTHRVVLRVNGQAFDVGQFDLVGAR